MAVPFLEAGLVQQVSRGEEVSSASTCKIVTMQSASDDSILASCGQLGYGMWKLVQLEPFATNSRSLIVQFRVTLLRSVVEPNCHVNVVH